MKRHIFVIFLSVLSGVCFGVALATHLLVTGSLNKTYRAYIVQSGSMEPALPVGAIVFTQSSSEYSVGDIITFTPNGGENMVTHRIVSSMENGFRTKGDANEDPDNLVVTRDQIIGKSIFSIPKVGYFADFVRTPKGFVILVVIPASIIIYEELKTVGNEIKNFVTKEGENKKTPHNIVLFIPFLGIVLMLLSYTGSLLTDHEVSSENSLSVESQDIEIPDLEIGN